MKKHTTKFAKQGQILRLAWRLGGALLFANMPAFCAAQNQDKKQKLEQAIHDLQERKNREIADSLYKVTNISKESFCIPAPDGSKFQLCQEGDVEELTKKHIYTANACIELLRLDASRPIRDKYPLSRFVTNVELYFINGDFVERIIYSIYNCSKHFDGGILSIDGEGYYWACDYLMEFPLDLASSVDDLESNIKTLNYLEHRPSETSRVDCETYDTQIPNEEPVVKMRDGKLLFKNPEAQKLYEQYKREMADVDKNYIFTNPEFASRYCEYSAQLKEAYEDREKLRKIGQFFDQKYKEQLEQYQHQLDSLNQLNH